MEKAKSPRSPRSRIRETQMQLRTESEKETGVIEFDSYAAFFAMTPESQVEVARRVREAAERNVGKQAKAPPFSKTSLMRRTIGTANALCKRDAGDGF